DPIVRAERFSAMITGHSEVLLDYYVEAVDTNGNIERSEIQSVYVGQALTDDTGPGGNSGGGFAMDGQLDGEAELVASYGGQNLYAALDGDQLYLATEDGGDGADVFIFLANQPGSLGPAQWGKSGQVAGWDAFLANENDNGWSGWFDTEGDQGESATGNGGGYLEGVLDLVAELGLEEIPEEIWVAVALYDTADGGELLAASLVSGPGNGDGNLDGVEYILLDLSLLTSLVGDYNGNGVVDAADYTIWADTFNSTTDLAADGNGDGVVDAADYTIWADNFGNAAALSSGAFPVPEPTSMALLLGVGGVLLGRRRA
ncbi:MAG: dockerin type I domain-containing protein, partial [Planctomycetota bacterium]